jgi:hypothetical protein
MEMIVSHQEFFRSAERRKAFKRRLKKDDNSNSIRMKMLAICTGEEVETRLEDILERLLGDLAHERREHIELIGQAA